MSSLPRHRTVADVMTTRVHVASPLTPFKHLVRLIEDNSISGVPIVDQQGQPVGIVCEADLLPAGSIAADIMTAPPITISATAPLAEAARCMQERNVRGLIVVDDRGKIAGIVSRSDLLQVLAAKR